MGIKAAWDCQVYGEVNQAGRACQTRARQSEISSRMIRVSGAKPPVVDDEGSVLDHYFAIVSGEDTHIGAREVLFDTSTGVVEPVSGPRTARRQERLCRC